MLIEYHDLSDKDFERLVVAICSEILGAGVVPFCSGKDGGRDARFEGTAAHLPSPADPYKGKFIVQAKHTEDPVAKYSDTDFSGDSESSVLSKEFPSVATLVADGHLDHYFLFANRRMSGVAEDPIRKRTAVETGAKSVELFGIERMDMLLRKFKDALKMFGLEPMSMPLLVTSEALSEVILAIRSNHEPLENAFKPDELQRVTFSSKNVENGLTGDLAQFIGRNYVPFFADVKKFLARPGNEEVVEKYECVVEEFNEQITLHRRSYATFDDVLIKVRNLLFYRDGDLARHKKLTNLIVYYMYWNCDIGKVKDDASPE